jgi:hypothetical protein
MKNVYLLLALVLIFASCKEEQILEENVNQYNVEQIFSEIYIDELPIRVTNVTCSPHIDTEGVFWSNIMEGRAFSESGEFLFLLRVSSNFNPDRNFPHSALFLYKNKFGYTFTGYSDSSSGQIFSRSKVSFDEIKLVRRIYDNHRQVIATQDMYISGEMFCSM